MESGSGPFQSSQHEATIPSSGAYEKWGDWNQHAGESNQVWWIDDNPHSSHAVEGTNHDTVPQVDSLQTNDPLAGTSANQSTMAMAFATPMMSAMPLNPSTASPEAAQPVQIIGPRTLPIKLALHP